MERKLKFENNKKCLKATQLESKINYLKIYIYIQIALKKNKQLIKNIKSILKTQQILLFLLKKLIRLL